MFPADSPWNTRIDSLPVSPRAAQYRANMAPTTHLHADWGNWSTDGYGIPWQTVPATQSLVPISFDYADESDLGPYPIPSSPLIEGHGTGDAHMLLLQMGTCVLYEVYAASRSSSGWHGGSGAKFNLSSNALRPDGWTSADAAGLPILPGLVRYDEVMSGEIAHAIRFTVSRTQNAFIHPATHGASTLTDPSYPPMGLRLRLRASFDTSKLAGPALVIVTAMKRYGIILADNGSNWYITGDSTDQWTSTLMSQVATAFSSVTGGDFEAVDTGPVIQQH